MPNCCAELEEGTANLGEFRRTQNWIGPAGCNLMTATFVPPPVPEMKESLGDLERFLHFEGPMPVLIHCGLTHARRRLQDVIDLACPVCVKLVDDRAVDVEPVEAVSLGLICASFNWYPASVLQMVAAGWSAGIHGLIRWDRVASPLGMISFTGIGRYFLPASKSAASCSRGVKQRGAISRRRHPIAATGRIGCRLLEEVCHNFCCGNAGL